MPQSSLAFDLSESGLIPDIIVRRGIRLLLKQRIKEISGGDIESATTLQNDFIRHMKSAPIAILTEKANEQHYEVPAEFFSLVLGEHKKYSSCYWNNSTHDLSSAEQLALSMTCNNADLHDGQKILELGCGWGSLTLYMAQTYPSSIITGVSNSNSQREYIINKARQQNISNIEIITCDMNDFVPDKQFDRIVSVEMMEHMRNYQLLYQKISHWLESDGKLFKHIFVHRSTPYPFDVKDDSDWMSKYFFSGGMMPSDDLPLWFQNDLNIEQRWRWSGKHYAKTADAWLANMDAKKENVWRILENTYGPNNTEKWWNRWRMFFMACSELFGYNSGQEWYVSHYRFKRK